MRRPHFLSFIVLSLFTSCLYGQWKQLASFNSQIVSIHFLSHEGHAEVGFVGTANGKVWKTTDQGNTWSITATPPILNGRVTSFTFKDSLMGWFCAAEDATIPCVYKTTDGGGNWIADTLLGNGTSITYNHFANPKTLVLTTWSKYNAVSTNEGLSWSRIGQRQEMCGVAYNNNNFGIMTAAQSKTITVTDDGGRSWRTLFNSTEEMWHPLAINNTSTFFAAAELAKQIWRSDNSGWDWYVIYQFPPTGLTVDLTGYIGGTLNALFIQAKNGIYVSTNQGQSWQEFCGPGNDYDTRMYVIGDTVYAGTVDGKLFANFYGVTHNKQLLEFPSDRLDFSSAGCFRLDSAIKLLNISTCLKVKLLDVQILGSSAFGTIGTTLPKTLGATDSIRIYYVPNDLIADSAELIVNYAVGDSSYEKRIKLKGNGKPGINIALNKELEMLLASDCAKLDTFITIKNGPCDSVALVSAVVSDPATFTLSTSVLPYVVSPDGTIKLSIAVNTVTPGDYTATVLLRFSTGRTTLDTTITLILKVLTAKEPLATYSKAEIAFDSVSTCDMRFDTLRITNTLCKQIILENAAVTPADPALSVLYLPTTPRLLLPNESDSVIVAYSPSSEIPLRAQISIRTAFDASSVRDTIIGISGVGKAVSDAMLVASSLTFPPMLECEENDLTTWLVNLSCDSASVIAIEQPQDAGFQILEPAVPSSMATGDTLPIRIRVGPISGGSKFDSVIIRIRTRSGAERLLKLTLLGTVKPRIRFMQLSDTLRLDSIPPCSVIDTFVYLTNSGICDTLSIDSVELSGASWCTGNFGPLPLRLYPKDSILVKLRIAPPVNGQSFGHIRFLGNGFDTSIVLHIGTGAYVDPLPMTVSDSAFAAFLCKNALQRISFSNPLCDTLVIDDLFISGSNAQFRFTSTVTLPLRLAPGRDTSIEIEFDPSGSGDSTAQLTIGSSIRNILKKIALTGSYRNTKGNASIEAIAPSGNKALSIGAGQFPTIEIRSDNQIEKARDLTKMECSLTFNDNVLTVSDIRPTKWQLIDRKDSTGMVRFTLKKNSAEDIAANELLATLVFFTTVGDSTWSAVDLSVRLNPDDSLYHSCVLEPLAMAPVIINIDDTCGDAFIRRWINKDLDLFDNFSIAPNPSDGSQDVLVSFDLKYSRDVALRLFNANGIEIFSQRYATLAKGNHRLRLLTPKLPEGWCFITIEAPEQRDVRKLLLK